MIKILGINKLPKNCMECFCYDAYADACGSADFYGVKCSSEKRPYKCPLRKGENDSADDLKYLKKLGWHK